MVIPPVSFRAARMAGPPCGKRGRPGRTGDGDPIYGVAAASWLADITVT
ncbi:MAG TPA: hypothetical protein VMU94_20395 [Streptosporangiaceae bacterium]|nr:hypothetical protein [Streptosporangiaceae bacterium]